MNLDFPKKTRLVTEFLYKTTNTTLTPTSWSTWKVSRHGTPIIVAVHDLEPERRDPLEHGLGRGPGTRRAEGPGHGAALDHPRAEALERDPQARLGGRSQGAHVPHDAVARDAATAARADEAILLDDDRAERLDDQDTATAATTAALLVIDEVDGSSVAGNPGRTGRLIPTTASTRATDGRGHLNAQRPNLNLIDNAVRLIDQFTFPFACNLRGAPSVQRHA